MGCSAVSGHSVFAAASGPETQRYFDLEGLPLTVSTKPSSGTEIELRVTGLGSNEALLRLELACARRGLVMLQGRLLNAGALTDWSFQLKMLSLLVGIMSPQKPYGKGSKVAILKAESVQQLEQGTVFAAKLPVVRVTVNYKLIAGCRAAVISALEAEGLRLVCGSLAGSVNVIEDTLWLQPSSKNNKLRTTLAAELPYRIHDAMAMCQNDGKPRPMPENTPDKRYAKCASPQELCSAIKAMDADALHGLRLSAPAALKESLKDIEYPMRGPCRGGFQVKGTEKYVGIGLVHRKEATAARGTPSAGTPTGEKEGPPLVLEIRTVFVPESTGVECKRQRLSRAMRVGKRYAEFVTWLNFQTRTWTIFKVFNNGILESGQRSGSLATAEHLLAPADMFFSAAQKGCEPAWLSSLQDAACGIKTIHICDAVNWNTYFLMTVANHKTRSVKDAFGETLQPVFTQELASSRLSPEKFQHASIEDVFKTTALGRMTCRILEAWDDQAVAGQAARSISKVSVTYHNDHFENIHGELRVRMDIDIELLQGCPVGCVQAPSVQSAGQKDLMEIAYFLESGLNVKGEVLTRSAHAFPRQPSGNPDLLRKAEILNLEAPTENLSPRDDAFAKRPLYKAGFVCSMSFLVHEVQVERAYSCAALAHLAASAPTQDARETKAAVSKARQRTDGAIRRILAMLHLVKADGELVRTKVFKDGLDIFNEVSTKLAVHRVEMDQAMQSAPIRWGRRFMVVNASGAGYHWLIKALIQWISTAIVTLADGQKMSGVQRAMTVQQEGEYANVAMFMEQIALERAFLAAKGEAHCNDADSTAQRLLKAMQHNRIQSGSVPACIQEMGEALLTPWLQTAHELRQEAEQEQLVITLERGQAFFKEMSDSLDAIEMRLREMMLEQTLEVPTSSALAPTAAAWLAPPSVGVPLNTADVTKQKDDLQEVVDGMCAGAFTRIVVMVGAGISVSAKLPDFRSPGGFYDQLKEQGLPCPEEVMSRDYFENNPQTFYGILKQLKTTDVDPTPAHCFLRLLEQKGLLLRCYTQNIDALERKAGVTVQKLVEAHGTMAEARCLNCCLPVSPEVLFPADGGEVPLCQACGGLLRPGITLYGEQLPQKFRDNADADLKQADLVIVMGTSLSVQPFAGLLGQLNHSCSLLLVNREVPNVIRAWKRSREVWGMTSRFTGRLPGKAGWLLGEIDEGVRWLSNHLGWGAELERVIADQPWKVPTTRSDWGQRCGRKTCEL